MNIFNIRNGKNMQTIAEILSKELNETLPHVQNVIELLDGAIRCPS